jgi:hypothetical protein
MPRSGCETWEATDNGVGGACGACCEPCGAECHFQPGWATLEVTLEETHGCALAFMAGAGMH